MKRRPRARRAAGTVPRMPRCRFGVKHRRGPAAADPHLRNPALPLYTHERGPTTHRPRGRADVRSVARARSFACTLHLCFSLRRAGRHSPGPTGNCLLQAGKACRACAWCLAGSCAGPVAALCSSRSVMAVTKPQDGCEGQAVAWLSCCCGGCGADWWAPAGTRCAGGHANCLRALVSAGAHSLAQASHQHFRVAVWLNPPLIYTPVAAFWPSDLLQLNSSAQIWSRRLNWKRDNT